MVDEYDDYDAYDGQPTLNYYQDDFIESSDDIFASLTPETENHATTSYHHQPFEEDEVEDYDDHSYYQGLESDARAAHHSDFGGQYETYDYDTENYFDQRSDVPAPHQQAAPATAGYNQGHWRPPHQPSQVADRRQLLPNNDFQPRMLSVAHRTSPVPQSRVQHQPQRGANPRNTHGIRLRPVSELPDMYRCVFKFGVFNAVQSTCFDSTMNSDENMVISAPTGSGKTVLFELAIIRLLSLEGGNRRGTKCVYIAPTKALCGERTRDWAAKFDALGAKCCELTGDTVQFGRSSWGDAKDANVIITTGEKWDSLTRSWSDHESILSQVQLVMVDEVHILNETRGATLEVVISRMKKRSNGQVRFVFVSATVPNIEDIADWIGRGGVGAANTGRPATIFAFDESYRPCKLTRHVHAYPRPKGQHDLVFSRTLDYKLFGVLTMHAVGKPVLVFCATRKGVLTTAQQLAKEYNEAMEKRVKLPWIKPPRIDHSFEDKRLNELAAVGIGLHHAGLSLDDRRAIENLYLKMVLKVVVATSTLAVGVNLRDQAAHTVVIKGVQTFHNNASQEYSDLDVMQMLGRAGRPQFDKEGLAIILCETALEEKYQQLSQGRTILESCLHLNLAEHLNSEIGLGTITSIESAKSWLKTSFLYRRVQKNPAHYRLALGDDAAGEGHSMNWEERIGEMVTLSVERLQGSELIMSGDSDGRGGDGRLTSTEYGDIMSKFYIKQSTMSAIMKLPARVTIRELLEMISASEEYSDLKLRSSEKTIYNKIRQHNDIRFTVKKVEKTSDKVFLLIQAVLGGVPLRAPEYKSSDSQPHAEALSVFRHVSRIARAIVEVAVVKKNGPQLKYGMELVRCLNSKAWEDRPVVLKQIPHIGEMSLKVLAEAGITSLDSLRKQNPERLELLLNRRPPFGHEIISCTKEFPEYSLKATELEVRSNGGRDPVEVDLSIECGLAMEMSKSIQRKKQKGRSSYMTAVLTLTSDLDLIDFRRIPTKSLQSLRTYEATAILSKPSQSVVISIASENYAGVVLTRTYKPNIKPNEYPIPNTRPLSSIEADLVGLEDDPNFWDISIDDSEVIPAKDLTKSSSVGTCPKETSARYQKALPSPSTSLLSAKLANGNYECNHTCKDKTSCRHLCCRDGLPGPPRKRKAGKSEDVAIRSSKLSDRSKQTLEQLETVHKQSRVALPPKEGVRLKIAGGDKSGARKPRIPALLDIELTDLTQGAPAPFNSDLEDEDEDDDIPELSEILHGGKNTVKTSRNPPSSETNYSNSEIDALIRDLPLEGPGRSPANHPCSPLIASGNESTSPDTSRPLLLAAPLSSLKRHPSVCGEQQIAKRSRRETVPVVGQNPVSSTPNPRLVGRATPGMIPSQRNLPSSVLSCSPIANRSQDTAEPLFLPLSREASPVHSGVLNEPGYNDDEFPLDMSFFDLLPDTPALATSGCTLSAKTSIGGRFAQSDMIETDGPTRTCLPKRGHFGGSTDVQRPPEKAVLEETQDKGTVDDPIAEFEAWLRSGSVVLVD